MADVLAPAPLQLPVVAQQRLLVRHAQLPHLPPILHSDELYEPPVPPSPEVHNLPLEFVVPAHHHCLDDSEELLREGMVNEAVAIFEGDDLPQVVLEDVAGGVGAGRHLIDFAVLGIAYLMGVQIILGLQIAEGDKFRGVKILPLGVDQLDGLVEGLELLLGHLHHRPEGDGLLTLGCGDVIQRGMQILPKGALDPRCKRGLVDRLLLVDDRVASLLAILAPLPVVLVGLPLLFLRITNSHNYIPLTTPLLFQPLSPVQTLYFDRSKDNLPINTYHFLSISHHSTLLFSTLDPRTSRTYFSNPSPLGHANGDPITSSSADMASRMPRLSTVSYLHKSDIKFSIRG